MINDIYNCRTHVFKVVVFLALLNYLRLLKSTKKIYISKKKFFQKNILFFIPKFEGFPLEGGPGDDLSGLGLRLALRIKIQLTSTFFKAFTDKKGKKK